MEDRFDAPPLEAKQLVELMRLETDLRKLRGLGCEAIAKAVSLHFTDDTPSARPRSLHARCVES